MRGQVGHQHAYTRLQNRVSKESDISGAESDSDIQEYRQTIRTFRRGRRFTSQVCYTRNLHSDRTGVLLNHLPGTKERRILASSHQPEARKQIHHEAEIQDVYSERRDSGGGSTRLDDVHRSQRRLSSHPNPQISVEVPKIRGRKKKVRVQSSSVRDHLSSESVHQSDRSCGGTSQEVLRPLYVSIPRRLSSQGPSQVILNLKVQGSDCIHPTSGSGDQLEEVRGVPNAESYVRRCQVPDRVRHSNSTGRQDHQHCCCSCHYQVQQTHHCQVLPEVLRTDQQLQLPSQLGSVIHATTSTLPSSSLETSDGGVRRSNPCQTSPSSTLAMVGEPTQPQRGNSTTGEGDFFQVGHRCKHDSVGGLSGGRWRSQRELDSERDPSTHKRPGNEGRVLRSDELPTPIGRATHSGEVRQHDSGLIHQQAGWNSFSDTLLPDMGHAELVQIQQHHSESNVSARQDECAGGSILKKGESTRVVSVSSNSKSTIQDMGDSADRSIRHQPIEEAADVLYEGVGLPSVRKGCNVDRLGRSGDICISTRTTNPKNSSEGERDQHEDDPHSSQLGKQIVVDRSSRAHHRHSSKASRKTSTTKAARSRRLSSTAGTSEALCVEDKRRSLRKRGFRKRTAELVTSDVRNSTIKNYSYKVRMFISWCDKNGHSNPVETSTSVICNYLQEKFDKGLSARTIAGYIAALSKWHKKIHGRKISEIEEVISLRKATAISRPPSKVHFKLWSLPLVLQSLVQEPFEPLDEAQLKFLSFKTIMLVALSTARRCSELGALSTKDSDFIQRPQGIEIGYIPNFIPKNARVNYAGKTIVVPAFEEMASCREERLMCPVRAINIYRKRTAMFRQDGENRLFITYGGDQGRGASKKTLARWLVETIRFAYAHANEEDCQVLKMNAHTTRAVSTTYAISKGVNIKHVIEAADWAAANTFINFYYKPGGAPGQQFAGAVLRAVKY